VGGGPAPVSATVFYVSKRKCDRQAVALLLYKMGVDVDTIAEVTGLTRGTVKVYANKYAKRLEPSGAPQQLWRQIQQILASARAQASPLDATDQPAPSARAPVQGQSAPPPRARAPEPAVPPAIADNAWVELIRSKQA